MTSIGSFGYLDEESMADDSQDWSLLKLLAPRDVACVEISCLRVGGPGCWYPDDGRSGEERRFGWQG